METSADSKASQEILSGNVNAEIVSALKAIGTLYQTSSHAAGASMQNAVANQQNMYSLGMASMVQNLQSILSLTSAAAARASAGTQQRSAPVFNYHPHPSYQAAPATTATQNSGTTAPPKQ